MPPSYNDNETCLNHARELAETRSAVEGIQSDVQDLRDSRSGEREVLQDVRDRLVRVETRLDFISQNLSKHTDKASEAFFRYAWPILLIAVTAMVTHYVK